MTACRLPTRSPTSLASIASCHLPHDQVVRLGGLDGLLTATGKVARAGDLPLEPVETWHREVQALRSPTALWDGLVADDEDSLRRPTPAPGS
jgi:hypothetical protein